MSNIDTAQRMGILTAAINTYGPTAQQDMMIEEMSELTKAICKHRRANRGPEESAAFENVLEEIADVQIMLDQMKILYGDPLEAEEVKLLRLADRINKEHAKGGTPDACTTHVFR